MTARRSFLLFSFFLFWTAAYSQDKQTISGLVSNAQSHSPLTQASVYIANTSHGTATNAKGNFELHHIAAGSFQLVVSSVGYVTRIFPFTGDSLPLVMNIAMDPKPTVLDSVTVSPFLKDGWEKWGQFFMYTFIGTSVIAREANILNYKSIKFRLPPGSNTLQAIAEEPLIIENKALGYRIKYDLEDYSYDTAQHVLFFQGFRYFEDLAKDMQKVPKRWLGNRRQTYQGSMMHFMRALYHNRLVEEGFDVTRMRKEGVDYFAKNNEALLTADSLLTTGEDSTRILYFKDYLSVTFKNAKSDVEYVNPESGKKGGWGQHSILHLNTKEPVMIQYNGNYYPPLNILLREYWGWSEKVGRILPLDYDPAAEKITN